MADNYQSWKPNVQQTPGDDETNGWLKRDGVVWSINDRKKYTVGIYKTLNKSSDSSYSQSGQGEEIYARQGGLTNTNTETLTVCGNITTIDPSDQSSRLYEFNRYSGDWASVYETVNSLSATWGPGIITFINENACKVGYCAVCKIDLSALVYDAALPGPIGPDGYPAIMFAGKKNYLAGGSGCIIGAPSQGGVIGDCLPGTPINKTIATIPIGSGDADGCNQIEYILPCILDTGIRVVFLENEIQPGRHITCIIRAADSDYNHTKYATTDRTIGDGFIRGTTDYANFFFPRTWRFISGNLDDGDWVTQYIPAWAAGSIAGAAGSVNSVKSKYWSVTLNKNEMGLLTLTRYSWHEPVIAHWSV